MACVGWGASACAFTCGIVEILRSGFAMLLSGASYRPSMVKFLTQFSKDAKSFEPPQLEQLRELLDSFLESCSELPQDAFHTSRGRFSPTIFESVFVAACEPPYAEGQLIKGRITSKSLSALKDDEAFKNATQSRTTASTNVVARLDRARSILELDQSESMAEDAEGVIERLRPSSTPN